MNKNYAELKYQIEEANSVYGLAKTFVDYVYVADKDNPAKHHIDLDKYTILTSFCKAVQSAYQASVVMPNIDRTQKLLQPETQLMINQAQQLANDALENLVGEIHVSLATDNQRIEQENEPHIKLQEHYTKTLGKWQERGYRAERITTKQYWKNHLEPMLGALEELHHIDLDIAAPNNLKGLGPKSPVKITVSSDALNTIRNKEPAPAPDIKSLSL